MRTIYVIASDPYDGWAKIGYAAGMAPNRRLARLQTANPRKLRLVAFWLVKWDLEAMMHKHFAPLRGCGEWFALPSALLMDMASLSHDLEDRKTWGGLQFTEVLQRWPAERILALGEHDATPEILAREFAAPATRPTTPKFKIMTNAG